MWPLKYAKANGARAFREPSSRENWHRPSFGGRLAIVAACVCTPAQRRSARWLPARRLSAWNRYAGTGAVSGWSASTIPMTTARASTSSGFSVRVNEVLGPQRIRGAWRGGPFGSVRVGAYDGVAFTHSRSLIASVGSDAFRISTGRSRLPSPGTARAPGGGGEQETCWSVLHRRPCWPPVPARSSRQPG
jgi:hypothetical protein